MKKWKPTSTQKALFKELVEQAKAKPCVACGGSGYYDVKGSPRCGACGGAGIEMDPRVTPR